MAIGVFRPDTCDCRLVFDYDDAVGWSTAVVIQQFTNPRGITYHTVICGKHTGKTLANIWQSAYLDHNIRKNEAVAELRGLFGAKVETDDKGETRLKDDVTWSYSGIGDSRVLNISVGTTLTAVEKTQLQAAVNTRLGLGKVVIT
jgi:hypothetical protein